MMSVEAQSANDADKSPWSWTMAITGRVEDPAARPLNQTALPQRAPSMAL